MQRHRAALLSLLAIVAASGCRSPVREDVYNQPPVQVFLRSEKSWQFGPLIEKDYDHPVTISPVRIAHILSRIDARIAGKREPAIQTDMIYPIAEGVSRALTRAGPEQEVVVMAINKTRHFGIFDHDYLTSFVVFVRGPQLFIHLARLNWEIPAKQKDKPEEPTIDAERMSFRVYPSEAMELVSKQGLAVDYKDDIFARATRTKILPTGKVVRKTVLLESDVQEPESEQDRERELEEELLARPPAAPTGLSPQQLRALADLEEARLSGAITEAEYVAKQQEIMEGGETAPEPATTR